MKNTMYGVIDTLTNTVIGYPFDTLEEAIADAHIRQKCHDMLMRRNKKAVHYVAGEIVEDGLEEMLVGYRKHYSPA